MIGDHQNMDERDRVSRRYGLVATVLYVVAIVLALWLVRWEVEPVEREDMTFGSILITFGDSEEGAGEIAQSEPEAEPTPVVEPTPEVVEPEPEPVPVPEPVVEPVAEVTPPPTPTVEESEVVTETPPEEQPTEVVPEAPREVDRRALFPGASAKKAESESHGTTDKSGQQGTTEGTSETLAQMGGGLSGDFDLAGRSLVGGLPRPVYEDQVEGRVVVNISVDEAGRVITAAADPTRSTTNDMRLIEAARKAALSARFTAESQSFVQNGTITYIFKLN